MGEQPENIMKTLREEFVPRETLDLRFSYIGDALKTIEERILKLPREFADEFGQRYDKRISHIETDVRTLEKDVRNLNKFLWMGLGGMGALNIALAIFETFFKH